MSSREAVRQALKVKIARFECPGEPVFVRSLSETCRSAYVKLHAEVKASGKEGLPSEVVAAFGICDEQGTLLYNFDSQDDLQELREFDGDALARVAMMVFELSGLTKRALDEAEKK